MQVVYDSAVVNKMPVGRLGSVPYATSINTRRPSASSGTIEAARDSVSPPKSRSPADHRNNVAATVGSSFCQLRNLVRLTVQGHFVFVVSVESARRT